MTFYDKIKGIEVVGVMIEKRNRHTIMVIFFLLIVVVLFQNRAYSVVDNVEYTYVDSIDYSESLVKLRNPERGFYGPRGYNIRPTNNKPLTPPASSSLVHLRVGLAAFSGNGTGAVDAELTEDALNNLVATIDAIRKNNASIIIRFSYDDFNWKTNMEPSMDMILRHIEQLGPVLLANKDVIAAIEMGFFGPCGELHSSKIGSQTNVAIATDKLLDATNEEMILSLRTPGHYSTWSKIDRTTIDQFITKKGTREYMVGIYNDGYLGSESDLGTFANRQKEVKWLSYQAKHTFYGGELVANFATGTPLNTIEYIQQEAFTTHTTYLNSEWNNEVINGFKKTPYVGDDTLYKNSTAYEYIDNHLGYRYVLKKSEITANLEKTDTLKAKLEIENVGFANLIREKKVSVVLENEHDVYEMITSIDPTTWNSKSTTKTSFSVDLPDAIKSGEYNVYLRISKYANLLSDSNFHCISFANKDIYNQDIGANFIGKVTIKDSDKPPVNNDDDKKLEENPPADDKKDPPVPTNPVNPPVNNDNNNTNNSNINTNTNPSNGNTTTNTNSNTNTNTNHNSTSTTSQTTSTNETTSKKEITVKEYLDYKIEYYYDGELDKAKTILLQGKKGQIIDSYPTKLIEGYVLEKVDNLPLRIKEDENQNIMRVYYVTKKDDYQEKEHSFPVTKEVEEENEKSPMNFFVFVIMILVALTLFIVIAKSLFKKNHEDKTDNEG